jgi:hypothetical protein
MLPGFSWNFVASEFSHVRTFVLQFGTRFSIGSYVDRVIIVQLHHEHGCKLQVEKLHATRERPAGAVVRRNAVASGRHLHGGSALLARHLLGEAEALWDDIRLIPKNSENTL